MLKEKTSKEEEVTQNASMTNKTKTRKVKRYRRQNKKVAQEKLQKEENIKNRGRGSMKNISETCPVCTQQPVL